MKLYRNYTSWEELQYDRIALVWDNPLKYVRLV